MVGKEDAAKEFLFHKERLTDHSEFCEVALSSNWLEGKEHIIRLPEDSAENFNIFHNFVYKRRVMIEWLHDQTRNEYDELLDDGEWDRLLDLWMLGDKLMSPTFKDAVVDRLAEKVAEEEYICPTNFHEKIYSMTTCSCGLRRLLVDIALSVWPERSLEEAEMDESWNEFFKDVAVRATSGKASGRVGKDNPIFEVLQCEYHDHGDEGACYKKMF